MLVCEASRGKGYANTFLCIWLQLCKRAGGEPLEAFEPD